MLFSGVHYFQNSTVISDIQFLDPIQNMWNELGLFQTSCHCHAELHAMQLHSDNTAVISKRQGEVALLDKAFYSADMLETCWYHNVCIEIGTAVAQRLKPCQASTAELAELI